MNRALALFDRSLAAVAIGFLVFIVGWRFPGSILRTERQPKQGWRFVMAMAVTEAAAGFVAEGLGTVAMAALGGTAMGRPTDTAAITMKAGVT